MKIVHTVEAYPSKGGIGEYLDALLPRLAAAGCEVLVLARAQNHQGEGPAGPAVRYVRGAAEVLEALREIKPDIVHVHGWPARQRLAAFYDSARPKIISHHHDYRFICPGGDLYWRRQREICQTGMGTRCLWHAYVKHCQRSRQVTEVIRSYQRVRQNLRLVSRGDGFIANSNFVGEKLAAAGIPRARLNVLNYFTDLRYQPQIAPVPGRILFIGRVAESKGVDALLEAVCGLDGGLDWSLVIAGDGYDLPRIRQMAAERGMGEKVRFTGWVSGEEKVRLLHEATVVAVPSRWPEAFGIVGIEAMACARPVVAFDTGGMRDWLTEGITGYLITPGETRALAATLGRLLADRSLAAQMGAAALRQSERFRSDSHVRNLLGIYQNYYSSIKKT